MKIDKFIEVSVLVGVTSTLARLFSSPIIAFAIKRGILDEKNSALINAIGFILVALFFAIFKLILKFTPLRIIKTKIRHLFSVIVNFIKNVSFIAKKYTAEERSTEKYKKAIEEQIKQSRRIYFRLISAHTMYYDEKEKFILDLLKKLTIAELDKKDIKIQLLDRSTISFEERARNFVDMMDKNGSPHRCSYEEYLKRCQDIENELSRIAGKDGISFYQRKYLWRLHIFDDVIFISTYSDTPQMTEGHLSSAYSFTRDCDDSLFDGFLKEFLSLYEKPQPSEFESTDPLLKPT